MLESDHADHKNKISVNYKDQLATYQIVKVLDFQSHLARMSVVVQDGTKFVLFTKGSPEMIQSLCNPASVPKDFDKKLHSKTKRGMRVVAFAMKTLTSKQINETRESLESNLIYTGILWMENKIKDVSAPVIAELHSNNIKSMMATGDNILTAISVAKNCNIIQQGIPIYYGDIMGGKLTWNEFEEPNPEHLESEIYSEKSHRLSEVQLVLKDDGAVSSD